MGDEDESARVTSSACSAIDDGGSGECRKGGKAFGDLGASDEAIAAKDERGRGRAAGSRQSWQGGMEQDASAKTQKSDRISARPLSGTKRHALEREAQGKRAYQLIATDGAAGFTGRRPGRRAQARCQAAYKRRERKAQEGALLLWDGSPHRWFGEKFGEWSLMAAIDDATGKLVCGVFARQEDAQSYLTCLRQIVLKNGIPLAMYMDRHGIFRRNDDHWTVQEQLAGQQTPTQVTQALLALGLKPIFALSPQAKGRVERLFNTLQDRLVQELRLARITSPEQATLFVNGSFRTDFNARFAKPAREIQAAWRSLPKELDVERICSFRYEATVGNDNAVRLAGMILDIPAGPRRRGYAKARVELRQLLDGRWRVYYKNELLLETAPCAAQVPLRTLRRNYRSSKPRKIVAAKKPPPYFAYNARSRTGRYPGVPHN